MATTPALTESPAVIRRLATYEEYLTLSGENRIAEWVDGEMIGYMPPLLPHQEVAWYLFRLLSGFVESLDPGMVGDAPLEFKLWPGGPSREPDVFFISQARLTALTERRYEGAPDIAVEVISTSSVREDRVRKFAEYERAGVGEYWLIDPRPYQQAAEFYRRDEAGVLQPVELVGGRFNSSVLTGLWLDVAWLWLDPLPSYRRSLQAIFDSSDAFPPDLRAI